MNERVRKSMNDQIALTIYSLLIFVSLDNDHKESAINFGNRCKPHLRPCLKCLISYSAICFTSIGHTVMRYS